MGWCMVPNFVSTVHLGRGGLGKFGYLPAGERAGRDGEGARGSAVQRQRQGTGKRRRRRAQKEKSPIWIRRWAGLQELDPKSKGQLQQTWLLLNVSRHGMFMTLPEQALSAMVGWSFFHGHFGCGVSLLVASYGMSCYVSGCCFPWAHQVR